MADFFDELADLFSFYSTYKNEVLFIGDFNIHVNKSSDRHAKYLLDLLEVFNLSQLITESTHQDGNTLDLVIAQRKSMVKKCEVSDFNSDHRNIIIQLCLNKIETKQLQFVKRCYAKFDEKSFKADL